MNSHGKPSTPEFTLVQEHVLDSCGIRNKSGWVQLARGYKALVGRYENNGLKTTAFANLLHDPTGLMVCVDSHAIMVWLGIHNRGGTVSFADGVYRKAAADYATVSLEYGLLPHQVQAIVWTARKRLLKAGTMAPTWFETWVECKYGERGDGQPNWLCTYEGLRQHMLAHPKLSEDGYHLPDYTMDHDVALHYGHADNIRYIMDLATKDDVLTGTTWYTDAHRDCMTVAGDLGVSFRYVCECVSALSPGRDWTGNVRAARVLAVECTKMGMM